MYLEKKSEENDDMLGKAIKMDLGSDEDFGVFRELELMMKEEIDHTVKNLKLRMQTSKADAPAVVFPGR
eukprot:EC719377.1.p2 GENE.EC719377.1~~EC719377.1.p2  ORF type:complete len:69 (+),score=15.93 EC719377.1:127-333(+)